VTLSVERVAFATSVKIQNISGISEDRITLYLESQEAGAGEVVNVQMNEEEDWAIVKFADRSGIRN